VLMAATDADLEVEECVRRDLHMLREAMNDEIDYSRTLDNASAAYHTEFLRQVRSGTIPTTAIALRNRCKKYVEAPADRRDIILRSKDDLRDIYARKHRRPAPSSWTPKTLIEKIMEDAPATAAEGAMSFEQDLMDTIVGQMCLPRLSDEAQEACQIGHEMEPILAREMMTLSKNKSIPLVIEEVNSVGLVEKTGQSSKPRSTAFLESRMVRKERSFFWSSKLESLNLRRRRRRTS